MPILTINLPTAGAVDYSGGDINYLISADPVRWDVTNRPSTHLARRDNLIAAKIDTEIIPQLNTNVTDLSAALLDISDLEAAVGSSGALMTPWTGTMNYIGATSTVKTALEALDAAVTGVDLSVDVSNLQTALGTGTDVFVPALAGTNYVDGDSALSAVVNLDSQLGQVSGWADSAIQKIDNDAGGVSVTWGVGNAFAVSGLSIVQAINAIDVALQVVNPTDFADVISTLDAENLAGNFVVVTGGGASALIADKTTSEALRGLDTQVVANEGAITALETDVNDVTSGLAPTYTLATQATDLTNRLKRAISFEQQGEGAFHAIQVEVFDISALENGSPLDPSDRYRFSSGPGSTYWYMRPVAVPKDYTVPSAGARTYDIDIEDLTAKTIRTPADPSDLGVGEHDMLALTWRRHLVPDNAAVDVDPVPLGDLSHSRGLFGEVSNIGRANGPWETVILQPPYTDFADGNPAIESSSLDLGNGIFQVVFAEDYRPYYEALAGNYLPLLYLSYFGAPRHSFLFFGDGVTAHGSPLADATDRGVIVPADVRGLPDRRLLSTYAPLPALTPAHWSSKFNAPLTRPGASYFTLLPKMLLDAGAVRRDIPMFIRIRTIQESALTGTCIAGPWASSILSF